MNIPNGAIALILITVVSAIALTGIKAAEVIIRFNRKTRYIAMKIRRASDYTEYLCWYKKLRCHYLCLIPFVGKAGAERLYSVLFTSKNQSERKNRSDCIYHVLAPSALAMLLCTVCLCATSWAWFQSSRQASVTAIQSAWYTADIHIISNGNTVPTVVGTDGVFSSEQALDSGEYTVTVTTHGSAIHSYCTVFLGQDTVYRTPIISMGTPYSFTVTANSEISSLKIVPHWGKYNTTEITVISDNRIIFGEKAPETGIPQNFPVNEPQIDSAPTVSDPAEDIPTQEPPAATEPVYPVVTPPSEIPPNAIPDSNGTNLPADTSAPDSSQADTTDTAELPDTGTDAGAISDDNAPDTAPSPQPEDDENTVPPSDSEIFTE